MYVIHIVSTYYIEMLCVVSICYPYGDVLRARYIHSTVVEYHYVIMNISYVILTCYIRILYHSIDSCYILMLNGYVISTFCIDILYPGAFPTALSPMLTCFNLVFYHKSPQNNGVFEVSFQHFFIKAHSNLSKFFL